MLVRCPAKVNLGLKVIRKRPDGYHDIESLFASVGLFDTLEIEPMSAFELMSSDPHLAVGPENTVSMARNELSLMLSKDINAKILIRKSIPAFAGLGGGSADGAGALIGLNEEFSLGLSEGELFDLGLKIGSDVPFQLKGGIAICTGRGEEIESLDFSLVENLECFLVMPGISISTKEAYSAIDEIGFSRAQPNTKELADYLSNGADKSIAVSNDFESYAFMHYPILAQIKETLLSLGALFAGMSGSGSSIYGVFKKGAFQHDTKNYFERFPSILIPFVEKGAYIMS